MDDHEIIALFLERNQEAIRQTAGKYGSLCGRLAHQILNNRSDEEECVNDTWLAAWNAIPPQQPVYFGAWLCRVVRLLSLKRLSFNTAARRKSEYAAAIEELEQVSSTETVESQIEARELARMIEGFLDTLSEENRLIFLRRYYFADSYSAIARRLALPEKTVSVRLTRMRHQLKKHLAEREVFV